MFYSLHNVIFYSFLVSLLQKIKEKQQKNYVSLKNENSTSKTFLSDKVFVIKILSLFL